jgi:hypothetical protein
VHCRTGVPAPAAREKPRSFTGEMERKAVLYLGWKKKEKSN